MSEAVETAVEEKPADVTANDAPAADDGKKGDAKQEKAAEAAGFDSAAHYKAWLDNISDPKRKDLAVRFKDLDDAFSNFETVRKQRDSRVKVPDDKATPEEIADFRKAIKASDKPEDYAVSAPDGYELGEPQQALIGQMQKAAVDAGIPVAAFGKFTETYFQMEQAIQGKIEAEVDQYRRDTDLALKKDLGKDYERYTRAAKDFVDNKLNVPEFTHLLEDKIQWNGVSMQLGSHPAVIKMLAQIGLRAGEDGVIGHTSPDQRASIQDQINQLERKHPLGRRTPQQDQQINALYKQLYPN